MNKLRELNTPAVSACQEAPTAAVSEIYFDTSGPVPELIQQKQEDDPQNWSHLGRSWESLKKIKQLHSGPHEEIPEWIVRSILAEQYGIQPEEVTPKQLRFELAGLLPQYPAIRLIPSYPIEDALQADVAEQRVHSEAVEAAADSRADAISPMAQSIGEELRRVEDKPIKDRRAAVDSYIETMHRKTGRKITRAQIWRSAGYKTRSEFERWERNDLRATAAARRNFTRILEGKNL
jgi:hypothetical protein